MARCPSWPRRWATAVPRVLVDTIVSVFDGEAVHRFILLASFADEARLELLGQLANVVMRQAP